MVATPLTLPTGFRFGEWTLRLVHSRDVSMLEGRFTESADFGTPYWTLSAKTASMPIAKADLFENFLFAPCAAGQHLSARTYTASGLAPMAKRRFLA